MSFLELVAKDISNRSKGNLENFCLVFPNKRASLFMTQFLKTELNSPGWLPEMLTIEEFIYKQSTLTEADPLTLNITLYEIFIQHMDSHEEFDQFFSWGNMLLQDFDDLDKYLVNAKDLFQVLLEEREILSDLSYLTEEQLEIIHRFWQSFNPPDYSETQLNFLKIWKILFTVYKDFNAKLRSAGKGYKGMIYREVAEKARRKEVTTEPYDQICFIGFNVLTKAEEILFTHLQKSGKVLFYWDVDKYYINNKSHEAGRYLRNYLKDFPSAIEVSDKFSKTTKEIVVAGIPLKTGQTDFIANEVALNTFEPVKTAIVLPDEELLFPIIQSLSGLVENINVTMGYPIKNSFVYTLIIDWLDIQRNFTSDNDPKIYYKKFFKLLSNPVFKSDYSESIDRFILKCKNDNIIYITENNLDEDLRFIQSIFHIAQNASETINHLVNFTSGFLENDEYSINQEFMFLIHLELKKISGLLENHKVKINSDTLFKIIRQYLKNLKIPFSGEPLNGLQVMGLLETRNIDFNTVFITDVNEGVLPKESNHSSFIPYNLRKVFKMPTHEHQDAMFAYYFYRLLQVPEKIYLLYNSQSTGDSRNELSRFILQLKYESGINIRFIEQSQFFSQKDIFPISIQKSEGILKILDRYTDNSDNPVALSPSALNTYIECRLKFYYRYVAGIKEPDALIENVDPAVFGNLLHHAMEELYKQFTLKKGTRLILKSDIQLIRPLIDTAIESAFKSVYKLSNEYELKGDQLIVQSVIRTYIEQILNVDEAYAPFEIFDMEGKFTKWLTIDNRKICIGGRIDRIDSKAETLRVLDYKTGNSNDVKVFSSLESLFERDDHKHKGYIFQVFMYAMIAMELAEVRGQKIQPGLFFIRDSNVTNYNTMIVHKENNQDNLVLDYLPYHSEFNDRLIELLNDLFDPTIPFTQVENQNVCSYCSFKELCSRN